MRARINKLHEHYVLCGFGWVGRQVAREFALDGVPFVVMDQDPEKVEGCLAEGSLALLGEASDDAVLEEVGVGRARGLVAAEDYLEVATSQDDSKSVVGEPKGIVTIDW